LQALPGRIDQVRAQHKGKVVRDRESEHEATSFALSKLMTDSEAVEFNVA